MASLAPVFPAMLGCANGEREERPGPVGRGEERTGNPAPRDLLEQAPTRTRGDLLFGYFLLWARKRKYLDRKCETCSIMWKHNAGYLQSVASGTLYHHMLIHEIIPPCS